MPYRRLSWNTALRELRDDCARAIPGVISARSLIQALARHRRTRLVTPAGAFDRAAITSPLGRFAPPVVPDLPPVLTAPQPSTSSTGSSLFWTMRTAILIARMAGMRSRASVLPRGTRAK